VFAARGTRQGGASHPLHAAAIQADASKLDHLDRVADFVRKTEEKVDVVVQRQPSREGAVALNHAETLRLHFDLNVGGPPSLVQ